MLKYIVVNGIFAVIVYCLGREGILTTAWGNDTLYIIPGILIVAAFGFVMLLRDYHTSEWAAETCIALGLFGTAFGVWTAFSGIDPSMVGDVNAIGSVIGVLLSGLGAALWTTMTGVFMNIWLSANIRMVEADHES